LNDHRAVADNAGKCNVADGDCHQVATAQLAVDREIEQRKISFRTCYLQPGPNAPDFAWFKRRLLADYVASVPTRHDLSPMPPSTAAAPDVSS
jgi:hypothetical protein